jgi:hypothetical protein
MPPQRLFGVPEFQKNENVEEVQSILLKGDILQMMCFLLGEGTAIFHVPPIVGNFLVMVANFFYCPRDPVSKHQCHGQKDVPILWMEGYPNHEHKMLESPIEVHGFWFPLSIPM